ncbi:MAG TPA: hypothetical protein VIP77_16630 [Jiangellaceae bacterium]
MASEAFGVGSSIGNARNPGSLRLVSPGEGVFSSVVFGVGNNRGASMSKLGRTAEPGELDWLLPYRDAVGVGRPGGDEDPEAGVRCADVGRS